MARITKNIRGQRSNSHSDGFIGNEFFGAMYKRKFEKIFNNSHHPSSRN